MQVKFLQSIETRKYVLVGKLWNRIGFGGEFMAGEIGVQKGGKPVFESLELKPGDRLVLGRVGHKTKEKSPDWLLFVLKSDLGRS